MRRNVSLVMLTVTVAAVAVPAGSAADTPSCVGQVASAPTTYPTEKADFVTFFAGPSFGPFVSGYARSDPATCPPLPTPG